MDCLTQSGVTVDSFVRQAGGFLSSPVLPVTCVFRVIFLMTLKIEYMTFLLSFIVRDGGSQFLGTSNIGFSSDDADTVECQVCLSLERKCEVNIYYVFCQSTVKPSPHQL